MVITLGLWWPTQPSPEAAPLRPPPVTLAPELLEKYAEEPQISVYDHSIAARRSMGIESYLLGVVNAETVPDWKTATLEAQAIVARTFTIRSMEEADNTPRVLHGTDACTSKDHFQAYEQRGISDDIRAAVENTRGLVLAYEDHIALTYFSSSSGGMTASLLEGFPDSPHRAPYLESVPSRDQEIAPDYAADWKTRVTRARLRSLLGRRALNASEVSVESRGESGRATVIRVGRRLVPAAELRTLLGPEVLRSTMITDITVGRTHVTFTGVGWGHGVGLDQWGAEAMARDGSSYLEILEHYLPGTRLVRLWD